MSNGFDMKCPRCGGDDQIDVEASIWVRLCHDGTDIDEAHRGDHEWNDASPAVCCACDFVGTVREFTEPEVCPVPECPICAGSGVHIGDLGQRRHFRCRDCGIDFSCELASAVMTDHAPEDRLKDNTVVIEVLGGVAHVTQCPANVSVKIIDHDEQGGAQ